MNYGLIGKIEKAKRYAEDPSRFRFDKFEVTFRGDNNDHYVSFADGKFQCDCEFFIGNGRCVHTMALEIVFENMITQVQEEAS
jgi:hypothetical protein